MTAPAPMRGFDIASIDQNASLNGLTVKEESSFAILRKSFIDWDGSKWVAIPDPDYAKNAKALRAAGVKVGAYLYPSLFKTKGPDDDHQLDVFFDATHGDIQPDIDIVPAFDIEFMGKGYTNTGYTQPELVDRIHSFLDKFEARISAMKGLKRGITGLAYVSHGIFHDSDTGLGNPRAAWFGRWKLWQKTAYVRGAKQPVYYGTIQPPHIAPAGWDESDYYRIPDPWVDRGVWFQQPQGDAIGIRGISNQADLDLFWTMSASSPHDPSRVKTVQRIVGATPDGFWGPETSAKIATYQTKHGQVADSIVGVGTITPMLWDPAWNAEDVATDGPYRSNPGTCQ